jgi:hypothetical protein
MLGELIDVAPAEVRIGMPVEVALTRIDDELTLPFWRPAGGAPPAAPNAHPAGGHAATLTPPGASSGRSRDRQLPEWTLEVTPTFVVASALATRDFQDVHHDRDAAVRRGSKDIFLNILTDTGLVQRFVTDWAGPQARVRRIAIRLGVPAYAYDSLVFHGAVSDQQGDDVTVTVTARGKLGDHIVGAVELTR